MVWAAVPTAECLCVEALHRLAVEVNQPFPIMRQVEAATKEMSAGVSGDVQELRQAAKRWAWVVPLHLTALQATKLLPGFAALYRVWEMKCW